MIQGAGMGERCSLALAAGLIAASSSSPVNPAMGAQAITELSKSIERERIS